MRIKLHPRTQAKVNEYARKKLEIYRNCRFGGKVSADYARFQAMFTLCDKLSGHVYEVVSGRELHYQFAWRKRKDAQR